MLFLHGFPEFWWDSNTLAHTRETLLYWDAARHRSEICCCGISPHYTHGVIDNIWHSNLSQIIIMKCNMGSIKSCTVLKCDMECHDIRSVLGPWSCLFSDYRTAIKTGLCLIIVTWLLSASLANLLLQNQWWTLGRVEETWRTPFSSDFCSTLVWCIQKVQVKDFPHCWVIEKCGG